MVVHVPYRRTVHRARAVCVHVLYTAAVHMICRVHGTPVRSAGYEWGRPGSLVYTARRETAEYWPQAA